MAQEHTPTEPKIGEVVLIGAFFFLAIAALNGFGEAVAIFIGNAVWVVELVFAYVGIAPHPGPSPSLFADPGSIIVGIAVLGIAPIASSAIAFHYTTRYLAPRAISGDDTSLHAALALLLSGTVFYAAWALIIYLVWAL